MAQKILCCVNNWSALRWFCMLFNRLNPSVFLKRGRRWLVFGSSDDQSILLYGTWWLVGWEDAFLSFVERQLFISLLSFILLLYLSFIWDDDLGWVGEIFLGQFCWSVCFSSVQLSQNTVPDERLWKCRVKSAAFLWPILVFCWLIHVSVFYFSEWWILFFSFLQMCRIGFRGHEVE